MLVTGISLFLFWNILLFVCLVTCKMGIIAVPISFYFYRNYYCISVHFLFILLGWKFMNPYTMLNLVKLSSNLVEIFKSPESSQASFPFSCIYFFSLPCRIYSFQCLILLFFFCLSHRYCYWGYQQCPFELFLSWMNNGLNVHFINHLK